MYLTKKSKYLPYFLLLPSLLLLIGVIVLPALDAVKESLFSWNLLKPQFREFTGFTNFKILLSDSIFFSALNFTMLFIIVTLSIEICFSLLAAIIVMGQAKLMKSLITTIVLIPFMLSPLIAGLMWKLLFSYDGLINYLLQNFHFMPISWMGSSNAAFLSTVIAEVWRSAPFVFLLCLASLSSLPVEPYEAAVVDGATNWQQFRYITFPLLRPTLTVIIIYQTVLKLRVFDLVYILTGGGPGTATLPLGLYLFRMYFRYFEAGTGSAIAVYMLILTVFFSFFILKYMFVEQRN